MSGKHKVVRLNPSCVQYFRTKAVRTNVDKIILMNVMCFVLFMRSVYFVESPASALSVCL